MAEAESASETEMQEVIVTYQVRFETRVRIPMDGTVEERRDAMEEALENLPIPEQDGVEYIQETFKPISFTDEEGRTVCRELKILNRDR